MDHGSGRARRALEAGAFHVSHTLHRAGMRLGEHRHRNACLHLVTGGCYVESTRTGGLEVRRGQVLLKPPGMGHWNEFRHGAASLRIDFPDHICRGAGLELPAGPAVIRETAGWRTGADILRELAASDDCTPLSVQGLCLLFVAETLRRFQPRSSEGAPQERSVSTRGEEYLRAHFREPLRFSRMARELGVARTHLAMAFRSERGCTLGEFVRRLRVEYVMDRLRGTSRPIAAIAAEAGFSDQSHCSRVFRRFTGLTPGAWRARNRP
ncbi:MAG: AraC family transcriptional regulator [Acidobacteriota bacterium]